MQLEREIQRLFDLGCFMQTRIQVLDHLFLTLGNGYMWKDGELVPKWEPDLVEPINPLCSGKAKQYNNLTTISECTLLRVHEAAEKHELYPLYAQTLLFAYPSEIKEDWLQGVKELLEYILHTEPDTSYLFEEVSKEFVQNFYTERFGGVVCG